MKFRANFWMNFWIGLAAIVFLAAGTSARAATRKVGFQQATVPDPQGKAIAVGIWYPTSSEVSHHSLGFFTQDVALNGTLAGEHLPLVLISHGVYGSMASHYDTAMALAEAGYVVAAPTHTGDSSSDQSYLGKRIDLIDRPRH